MMPAAVAERCGACEGIAPSARAQRAERAVERPAVPADLDAAARGAERPGEHRPGIRKRHVGRHVDPEGDRAGGAFGDAGKGRLRIRLAVEPERIPPAALGAGAGGERLAGRFDLRGETLLSEADRLRMCGAGLLVE